MGSYSLDGGGAVIYYFVITSVGDLELDGGCCGLLPHSRALRSKFTSTIVHQWKQSTGQGHCGGTAIDLWRCEMYMYLVDVEHINKGKRTTVTHHSPKYLESKMLQSIYNYLSFGSSMCP